MSLSLAWHLSKGDTAWSLMRFERPCDDAQSKTNPSLLLPNMKVVLSLDVVRPP